MGRLDERVAVITGAGDGIGAGIARRFAEEGARVLVAEMNEDDGPRHRRRAGVDDRRGDAVRPHRRAPQGGQRRR